MSAQARFVFFKSPFDICRDAGVNTAVVALEEVYEVHMEGDGAY